MSTLAESLRHLAEASNFLDDVGVVPVAIKRHDNGPWQVWVRPDDFERIAATTPRSLLCQGRHNLFFRQVSLVRDEVLYTTLAPETELPIEAVLEAFAEIVAARVSVPGRPPLTACPN